MSITSIFVDSRSAQLRIKTLRARRDLVLEPPEVRTIPSFVPPVSCAVSLPPALVAAGHSAAAGDVNARGKLMVFLALSALDFMLTMQLLNQSGGWIYESNPLANWWLARGGWFGLALFKIGIVAVVGCCWLTISPLRPQLAGMVLSFACAMLALAVLYSGFLSCYLRAYPEEAGIEQVQQLEAEDRLLSQRIGANLRFLAAQHELGLDMAAGRMNLTEAVERLAGLPESRDPVWIAMRIRTFPGLSDEQFLAASLTAHALSSSREPEVAQRLRLQLVEDFKIPAERLARFGLY